MKTIKKSVHSASSFLQLLHCIFVDLPNNFRDKILKECAFSVPTYYRRVRDESPASSNADKDKIAQIAIDCLKQAIAECEAIISRRNSLN